MHFAFIQEKYTKYYPRKEYRAITFDQAEKMMFLSEIQRGSLFLLSRSLDALKCIEFSGKKKIYNRL